MRFALMATLRTPAKHTEANMRAATLKLTDEQIGLFHTQGYLRLPQFTTPQEADCIARIFDRILADRSVSGLGFEREGDSCNASLLQMLNPVYDAPELVDTIVRANATAVARQILGPDAAFAGEQAMIKPAGHKLATEWHQDEAYWDGAFDYDVITFWVALQETTTENGCLKFLPRTHTWEVIAHHIVDANAPVADFEIDRLGIIDPSKVCICPLPKGGATVHGSRTLHAAMPNSTNSARKGYSMGFSRRPIPRAQPRNFYWNPRCFPRQRINQDDLRCNEALRTK